MKTIESQYQDMLHGVDLDQEVEYHTELNGHPFIITGPFNDHLADRIKADLAYNEALGRAEAARKVEVTTELAKTALAAPVTATRGLLGRVATDIKVKAYDKVHGRNFYADLKRERAERRDIRFLGEIGLL